MVMKLRSFEKITSFFSAGKNSLIKTTICLSFLCQTQHVGDGVNSLSCFIDAPLTIYRSVLLLCYALFYVIVDALGGKLQTDV